jgi:hypothetical protein|tara:strand:+ start:40522 stop:41157 length:636 start_codon:yes stop_codon:yes gene_type:complete
MVQIKDDTIPARIKSCLEVFVRQGNWSSEGVARSLLRQHSRKGSLTSKQHAMVEVWERDYIADDKDWEDEYSASKEKISLFERAVSYFDSTDSLYYYRQRIAHLKNPEGYIPTHRDFDKMTQNKYFARWLEASGKKPKFKVGDLVESRQGTGSRWYLKGLQFVVTSVTDKIDPCKGGRWYGGYPIAGEVRYGTKRQRVTSFREKEMKVFRK